MRAWAAALVVLHAAALSSSAPLRAPAPDAQAGRYPLALCRRGRVLEALALRGGQGGPDEEDSAGDDGPTGTLPRRRVQAVRRGAGGWGMAARDGADVCPRRHAPHAARPGRDEAAATLAKAEQLYRAAVTGKKKGQDASTRAEEGSCSSFLKAVSVCV